MLPSDKHKKWLRAGRRSQTMPWEMSEKIILSTTLHYEADPIRWGRYEDNKKVRVICQSWVFFSTETLFVVQETAGFQSHPKRPDVLTRIWDYTGDRSQRGVAHADFYSFWQISEVSWHRGQKQTEDNKAATRRHMCSAGGSSTDRVQAAPQASSRLQSEDTTGYWHHIISRHDPVITPLGNDLHGANKMLVLTHLRPLILKFSFMSIYKNRILFRNILLLRALTSYIEL